MSFPRIALHDAADLAAVLEPVRAAAEARLERAPLDAGAREAGRRALEAVSAATCDGVAPVLTRPHPSGCKSPSGTCRRT
jgi:hypothetical protein